MPVSESFSTTVYKLWETKLHYHLILHCAVRSPCEMVSVAPRMRAEARNRDLRVMVKAGRSGLYPACGRVCGRLLNRLDQLWGVKRGEYGSCGKLEKKTAQHWLTQTTWWREWDCGKKAKQHRKHRKNIFMSWTGNCVCSGLLSVDKSETDFYTFYFLLVE